MPRNVIPLSDTKLESAKPKPKEFKLFDGRGLYLLVKPSGVKVWRMKYKRPDGRKGLLTFGVYPYVPLKVARDHRASALKQLAEGIDPMALKAEKKLLELSAAKDALHQVALAWHKEQSQRWSPSHAHKILQRLEQYLFPDMGTMQIRHLKAADLLKPIKKVEAVGHLDVAKRLRQHIEGILRYAVIHGLIDSNPARDLQGIVLETNTTHRPALSLEQLPELLKRINTYVGKQATRNALLFSLLTFVRSSELRYARWSEVDFNNNLWTIPATREAIEGVEYSGRGSKMKTPHLVPLSHQALSVLNAMHTQENVFIFTSDYDPLKPMSENTINAALRRMGYDTKTEICGHGFRTMACSALMESGLWSKDAVERQMSHQERNSVRAAYIHKAEHIKERQAMVQWWADYLDKIKDGFIAPFECV